MLCPAQSGLYVIKCFALRQRRVNVDSIKNRISLYNAIASVSLAVVVVVVLTLTRITKSVVTGQAPVTLELRNTPGKSINNPRWYTHISQLTQFMPPPETCMLLCPVHCIFVPSFSALSLQLAVQSAASLFSAPPSSVTSPAVFKKYYWYVL